MSDYMEALEQAKLNRVKGMGQCTACGSEWTHHKTGMCEKCRTRTCSNPRCDVVIRCHTIPAIKNYCNKHRYSKDEI